jgi:SAM-dependent methyltransferase
MDLRAQFGALDIYLFDQLLRGRLVPGMSLLDAGCGGGRNLVYFLREGFEVHGIDADPKAVEAVRRLAAELAPRLPSENFQVDEVESLPFPAARFDAVVCNAVLHFARDEAHFDRMLDAMWRVLKPGGMFFARLASSIGMESRLPRTRGRCTLPDGTERFVVDEALLAAAAQRLGAQPLDPLKTTIVQNLRCMTTWVLRKALS